jgi:hypothetical protein
MTIKKEILPYVGTAFCTLMPPKSKKRISYPYKQFPVPIFLQPLCFLQQA